MPIRAVLFDKDGTLLDYRRTWIPINRDVAHFAAGGDMGLAAALLADGGHDPVSDHIMPGSVLAAGTHDEVAEVFAARLGGRTPPDLAANIERLFREGGGRHSALIDGVIELLDRLQAGGMSLGVASNDSPGGVHASLGRHVGLLDRFDFLCGCDSGFGIKPEPGMVHEFCRSISVEPGDIAVVGDAVHDLEMGRRAGVGLRVGVLGGTSPREVLHAHADVVLDRIADLADVLRSAPLTGDQTVS